MKGKVRLMGGSAGRLRGREDEPAQRRFLEKQQAMRKVNPQAAYVQQELPYAYCNTCGRKTYQLARAGLLCQGPLMGRGGYCAGTLVLSGQPTNSNVDATDQVAFS
jgi:hypothetical protein